MTIYAEVAVDVPVHSTFHYHIPPELEGQITPGHLVRVAFRTAMQPGIVIALHDTSPVEQTKPVLERLDPEPIINAEQIALARWMSDRYFAPPGACLWRMLPPGIVGHRDVLITLLKEDMAPDDKKQAQITAMLRERGSLRGEQIKRSVKDPQRAIDALVKAGIVYSQAILAPPRTRPLMVQMVALTIHPDRIPDYVSHLGRKSPQADLLQAVAIDEGLLTPKDALALPGIGKTSLDKVLATGLVIKDSTDHLRLNIPSDQLNQALIELRQAEDDLHILRVLAREGKAVDVSWVYAQTGASLADLKRLAALGVVQLGEKHTWRDSLADRDFVPTSPPRLTKGQQAVWEVVRSAIDAQHSETPLSGSAFLLHGVTGSGKTEVYLRAIERVLAQGRQAIFLVPEIALTAQTIRRVLVRFPGRVAVVGETEANEQPDSGQVALVHSKLSTGERYDTWQRARQGLVDVVVGTRSALFTPLPDVGLIILDEEHDDSYKQSPPTPAPYYHAREVAEQITRLNGGTLILGSATPALDTYFRAQNGDTSGHGITYLHLPDRIMGHRVRIAEQSERAGVPPRYGDLPPDEASNDHADAVTIDLPPVEIVDMRVELKAGNNSIFSVALQTALGDTLARGEQAILFLNRRGTSTYVFCRDCGYVATCPRCDMPLTYHQSGTDLRCHHCGHQQPAPAICPSCGSRRIKFFGAGTQQVETALNQLFREAVALRWDADTASKSDAHDHILIRFIERQADVLIGTQMIAKGLDLPFVTMVGVISADTGLGMPDFRACERTFQLLTQVAGRAGRGLLGGKVILQTYQPDHYAIRAAAQHDYAGFYEQEIAYRREIGYPPFRRMVRLLFRAATDTRAHDEAMQAATILRRRLTDLNLSATSIIGPAPCFFNRFNRLYRWHIILCGPDPVQALQGFDIPGDWIVDVDPVDLL